MKISVIVPAHNAEGLLPGCLDAILASTHPPHELIVVDDRSTDRTALLARERGALVLAGKSGTGPAAARNTGARRATGDVLLFVDADVIVQPDTLDRVAADFREHPEITAVFGSYDDEPAARNFLSQYKNLQHHYVHQQGNVDAATFWAGCGAVRRDVFLDLGGFDFERFPEPSIEDIELGYRMKARGHRILLDKQLCVKHLKRWRFWPLLRTEIVCRAGPWSRLILESKRVVRDLNLRIAERVSAALAWLTLLLLPLALVWRAALLAALACFVGLLVINHDFYGFLLRRRGLLFTLRAVPMHVLYFLYSSATFASWWLRARLVP